VNRVTFWTFNTLLSTIRYRKTSANTLFAFRARNIPYLQTVPFGPNWPDAPDTHQVQGRSKWRTLHGTSTATAAIIPQRGSAPSSHGGIVGFSEVGHFCNLGQTWPGRAFAALGLEKRGHFRTLSLDDYLWQECHAFAVLRRRQRSGFHFRTF
jgi:hypothetical protein